MLNIHFFPVTAYYNRQIQINKSVCYLIKVIGSKVVTVGVLNSKTSHNVQDIYGQLLLTTDVGMKMTLYVIFRNNILHSLSPGIDDDIINFLIEEPEESNKIETLKFLKAVLRL